MDNKNSHAQSVSEQFSPNAQNYLTSAVHAQGPDLTRLSALLTPYSDALVVDLGCGAGHASFAVSKSVKKVIAYDLSAEMLAVVKHAAADRGLKNIETRQGYAESLPFEDASVDVAISRYSAHHWHDVGAALREVRRILKPGGKVVMMDIASPGHPVLDVHLQTIEKLRDTSHVRNYSSGEWFQLFNEAGIRIESLTTGKLTLEFSSWVARLKTPEHFVVAIRELQKASSEEVVQYFAIAQDGTFETDTLFIEASKI
ncbi:class I SAM-dependent methyltransferase [Rouxiella badensis]|uniref:class I SAM-dependent methyltransferase n=1 Tax=Rouxiella badensis TaxID=1646377 RepID=UPI0028D77FF3|nr:class I SAM-dependent methyltransferase [Rouxiella badensis]